MLLLHELARTVVNTSDILASRVKRYSFASTEFPVPEALSVGPSNSVCDRPQ